MITVTNPAGIPALIQSVTDVISPDIPAPPLCGVIPRTDPDRALAIEYASTLDQFNNWYLGVPHCDDEYVAADSAPERSSFLIDLATNISVTDGQTRAGVDASLAQAGSIAGRVTDGETGAGVADVVATAWINEGGVWRQASIAVTANNGAYTLGGLAGGQAYRVKFVDGVAPPRYLEEYYDNVSTIAAATPVDVVAGQVTPDIDAALGS